MYRYLYIYFLSISTIFPINLEDNSNYQNLYLMNFDNILEDYSVQNLSSKFPQLIKNEFSDKAYLNILDAPKVIPTAFNHNSNLKDGVIINGKYFLSNNLIVVSFDAYDVDTWDKQASRTYYCDFDDQECIEKAFLVCVEEDIIPLFCSYYDCQGQCNGDAVVDCQGECNGSAFEDCRGICNGSAKVDCKGECNGDALLDHCEQCDYTTKNDCMMDCNGDWGGDSFINVCGKCVEGNTGFSITRGMDCLGNCYGEASIDCNGDCNGSAFINDCNVCVSGNTGNIISLGLDCSGKCFGDSFLDQCGICNGDNSSCSDCKGVPNGNAILDDCGNCDFTDQNDCIKDCNGDWGGSAHLNECYVCVEGNTGLDYDNGMDCQGVCWGNSKFDSCGVCNGNDLCDKPVYKNDNMTDNNHDTKKYFHQNSKSKISFNHLNNNSSNKEKSAQYLYNIIDNLKEEVYYTNIGDFKESYDDDKITLEIPVTYSINKNFMNNFRYAEEVNNNNSIIYRFPNSKLNISEDFEKYISSMKYQLVPVLFFYDNNDEILFLMIDSWNDSYSLRGNLNIINKVGFNPLFSITPGESSLQFNFDKNSITNNYQFSLSNNQYNQLGYMFVKFFHEHSLESDIYHYIYNK